MGDEVIALLAGGGYAEYVACPEHHAIKKPMKLDWIEGASIPEVYATCWLNLFMEAGMKKSYQFKNLRNYYALLFCDI